MMSDDSVIRELTRELVSAFNDADVDRMMALHAGRYVDVNLPQPVQTHSERAEYYRSVVSKRDLRIEVVPDEIIVDGGHAIVRGTIHLFKVDGSPARELRYVELWEKQSAGWKSIWGIDAAVHD